MFITSNSDALTYYVKLDKKSQSSSTIRTKKSIKSTNPNRIKHRRGLLNVFKTLFLQAVLIRAGRNNKIFFSIHPKPKMFRLSFLLYWSP